MIKLHNPFRPIRAYAWFSPTHTLIFDAAFELLKKRRPEIHRALRPYYEYIAQGVVVPDFKGDINKGSGSHYYSAVLKDGSQAEQIEGYYKNRLGRFSKSARTMCEENITIAALYKSFKNRKMYGESLGRALHFIMDVCCTVHAANLISLPIKGNPHHTYETYALNNMKKFISSDIPNIDELEAKYLPMSVGEIFNFASKLSATFYGDVCQKEEGGFNKALSQMLPTAVALSCILMIKAYESVESYKGIKEGDVFFLKSGNEFIYSKKSRLGFTQNKKDALHFSLACHGDRLYLKSGLKYLTSDGDYGFRLAGLSSHCAIRVTKQGGEYLFSTHFSNGDKYLLCQRSRLVSKHFDPREKGFYFKAQKA